jgi:alkyl hydroperoxide reductase subunit AhpF
MAAERALFVFIGAEANTGWLQGAVELDERGFVLTGREVDCSVVEGERLGRTFAATVPLGGEHAGGIRGRRHA